MKKVLAVILCLSMGCAAGRAQFKEMTVITDEGAYTVKVCEVSGIAIGRALIATDTEYWRGIEPRDKNAESDHETVNGCSAIHGGTGSAGWYAAIGAALGAAAAGLTRWLF